MLKSSDPAKHITIYERLDLFVSVPKQHEH
jgi:hypothetical protein